MYRIDWTPVTLSGFIAAVLFASLAVAVLNREIKPSAHWIFFYWPIILVTFDFAVLYGISVTQSGDLRGIGIVITSILVVPTYWIAVIMTKSGHRERTFRMIFESDPESKSAYVRPRIDAADLAQHGIMTDARVSASYLVIRSSRVELRRSPGRDPWLVLQWPQILGAGASSEIYHGHGYEAADLDDGVKYLEGGAKVRFLCTLNILPGVLVPLYVNGQGDSDLRGRPDRTASMIAEIINERVADTAVAKEKRDIPHTGDADRPGGASAPHSEHSAVLLNQQPGPPAVRHDG